MMKKILVSGGLILTGLAAAPASAAPLLTIGITPGPNVTYGTCSATLSSFQTCTIFGTANAPSFMLAFQGGSSGVVTLNRFSGALTNVSFSISFTGINTPLVGATFGSAGGVTNFGPQNVLFSNGVATVTFSGVTIANGGVSINLLSELPAAVPETATWGMMIAGFGMMGAAMRTRRRSVKVTYA